MIDILIIIDNPLREHLNLNLLKKIFTHKGLSSRIVSKHLFEYAIYKYKPQSVIVPRVTGGFSKIFDLSKKIKFHIYLLPCEHGAGEKARIISFLTGAENRNNYDLSNFRNYKNILKFFVPSEPYKKICIDSGLFSEDQINLAFSKINKSLQKDGIFIVDMNTEHNFFSTFYHNFYLKIESILIYLFSKILNKKIGLIFDENFGYNYKKKEIIDIAIKNNFKLLSINSIGKNEINRSFIFRKLSKNNKFIEKVLWKIFKLIPYHNIYKFKKL